MLIEYDVECFERTLQIKFPEGYEHLKDEILKMLDEYYFYWHDAENIEDPDEKSAVEDACLEEYMMDRLSETYGMWEEWESIPYGEDAEERENMWVCERCLMGIESHEGNQATLAHGVDEMDAVESRCDWCKSCGHDTLYELV
jgi:hypothetical protein